MWAINKNKLVEGKPSFDNSSGRCRGNIHFTNSEEPKLKLNSSNSKQNKH